MRAPVWRSSLVCIEETFSTVDCILQYLFIYLDLATLQYPPWEGSNLENRLLNIEIHIFGGIYGLI